MQGINNYLRFKDGGSASSPQGDLTQQLIILSFAMAQGQSLEPTGGLLQLAVSEKR